MSQSQEKAFALIAAQQKSAGEYSTTWTVGEQLKEICLREPDKAEILAQDLAVPEMSLALAEKKIKAWADKQPRNGGVGVPPHVAEGILREFYGLGKTGERPAPVASDGGITINLEDYF